MREGPSYPSGCSTKVSMERPSTSVSMELRNARTLRPVIRSTGSQNSVTVAYWKNMRVSRSRWCSPILTRLRSARVRVSSRKVVSALGPDQYVRVIVGPRPKNSLYTPVMAFEISERSIARVSRSVGSCSSVDTRTTFPLLGIVALKSRSKSPERYPQRSAEKASVELGFSQVVACRLLLSPAIRQQAAAHVHRVNGHIEEPASARRASCRGFVQFRGYLGRHAADLPDPGAPIPGRNLGARVGRRTRHDGCSFAGGEAQRSISGERQGGLRFRRS